VRSKRSTHISFGIAFTFLFIIVALMPSPAMAQNEAPVADAGPDQEVEITDIIYLDGNATDSDGDSIVEWRWTVESYPIGSPPVIQWPDYPNPRFVPYMSGDYVLSLIAFDGLEWCTWPDYVTIHVRVPITPPVGNSAPVVNAGLDQELEIGEGMFLDGSATDPDGNPIVEWLWSVESGPAVENLLIEYSDEPSMFISVMSDPNEDPSGDYVLSLIAFDGLEWSEPDYVNIHVSEPLDPPIGPWFNSAPVVNAGLDQELVVIYDFTRLDGKGGDPDGDPIVQWLWYVESAPAGSSPSLQWPDYPDPSFYADTAGDYVLGFIAFDGLDWSESDYVTIHVTEPSSPPPVVDAGPDQELAVGDITRLEGSATDLNGDPTLAWRWEVMGRLSPAGSSVNIALPSMSDPYFSANMAGDYILRLSATDDLWTWSRTDDFNWVKGTEYVKIHVIDLNSPPDSPPVVDAGPDQELVAGYTTSLDGRGGDPDGDPIINWHWYVESSPAGSFLSIQWPDYPDPLFFADTAGDYVLGLVAFDGIYWSSEPDYVTIHVREHIEPKAVIIADVVEGPAPLSVQFDGSTSTVDPMIEPLEYNWDFDEGETAVGATVTHTFDNPDTYTVSLTVVDAKGQSDTESIEITVTAPNNPPVISPTTTPNSGIAPLTVQFNANAEDPDGDSLTYEWDLDGDGEFDDSTEANPSYTYSEAGEYTACLIVTDEEGASVSASLNVVVYDPVEEIEDLSAYLDGLEGVDADTKSALNIKLTSVVDKLDKNDNDKAIKKLEDFIKFVDEMVSEGRLDSAEAEYLKSEANSIIELLQSSEG